MMRSFLRVLLTFIGLLLIYFSISFCFGGEVISILSHPKIWVSAFVFLLISLAISAAIFYLFANKNHERYFLISALVTLGLYMLLNLGFRISIWNHHRNFDNIESNQDYFKYWVGPFVNEMQLGFDSLAKNFPTANDIRISGSSADTALYISGDQFDTLYKFTFNYNKKGQENLYKSEVEVFRNEAKIIYFDSLLSLKDLYEIDSFQKSAIKNLREALQVMPDSVKSHLETEFKGLLDRK